MASTSPNISALSNPPSQLEAIFAGQTGSPPASTNSPWAISVQPSNEINHDEVYRCCFAARDSLLAVANKYRQKLKLPPLSVSTTHSWTEVEGELHTACSAVEALAAKDQDYSGAVGKLRRVFRGLCQHANAGQTFVSLVPSDAFGFSSIVCGTLKAIFTGLYQTAVYRDEVYKALEELPYTLMDHSAPIDMSLHGGDEELHSRTAALYVAVFRLLEHLLGWFLKNSFATQVKLLVDPSRFSEKLKEKLAQVKLSAQRWERRALRLSMQSQNEALRLQYWSTFVQSRMDRNMQTILSRTEHLEDRLSRSSILESLDSFLQVIVNTLEKGPQSQRQGRLTSGTSTAAADLLKRFLYEPGLMTGDCTALARNLSQKSRHSRGASRTVLSQDRITALQTNLRIRAWLTVDEPSLLLLNGRARPHPCSETSLVAAQIIQRVLCRYEETSSTEANTAILIPLAFFCGQHRDWQRDPNGTPIEAAMSLLLQLVDRHGASLPEDALAECLSETNPRDMSSILRSVEKLILRLGRNVILIVVVDGIRFFAYPAERRRQMRQLVEGLVDIYRKRPAATQKFLFASPTRFDFVEDLFGPAEMLTLPRDLRKTAADDGRDRLPELPVGSEKEEEEEEEEGSYGSEFEGG